MFRGRPFGLLKSLHFLDGHPNLAHKFIHPAITSHVHHCQKRNVDYRQSYRTGPSSAGRRTLDVPQTKVMAEQELPGVLILDIGGTHGVLENHVALLKKHFRLITMKEFLENKKEVSKKIQSVFVFECRPTIDRELLESLPNLKVIGNSGVGVDHLDVKMISNFGVKVTNTPHAVADSTADIGMALMLASARRLVEGCQIAISSDTKYFAVDWLGVEVTKATLGIIGMGSIGYKVAQRAKAFEMKILYHNRNQRKKEEEQAVGAHYCEKMEDLLQQSDFVMLVVNLTPETHKLIGKRELGLMKPTATLINISRGAVIDQDALVEALQKKVIMAAALDVTYPEPLPRDHPLLKLNNIIITPHIGTATVQAIHMMAEEAIANMLAALNANVAEISNIVAVVYPDIKTLEKADSIEMILGLRFSMIVGGRELPGLLVNEIGGIHGVLHSHVEFLKKHFYLITMKEFIEDRKHLSKKVQAIYLWWHKPVIDQELLQSLPNLKVIANSGVGMDHLDLKLVATFGVKMANAPRAVSSSTADTGMALLLASARRLVEGCHVAVSPAMEYCEADFLGVKVTRATLGIIGMGSIGYKIALRARAFEMNILYHNRTRKKTHEEQLVGAVYCEKIDSLLQQSDFVMVVVSLTPQTHKLIGKREMELMKPTATLINISRGAVVDQEALVRALQDGVIRAAALDVTYPEPLPRDHPLLKLKNIIITPHLGIKTEKATRMITEEAVENILAALNGLPIPNEVLPS